MVLAVGKPCALRGGLRLLRKPPDNATAPAGAAVIVCAGLSCFRFGNSLLPARTNLPPAALFAAMTHSRKDNKIVTKRVYSVLGINMEGQKEILGTWISENESASFYASICSDLKSRGVKDIFIFQ